jgi:peptide/nickel transport system ATP-binding protein
MSDDAVLLEVRNLKKYFPIKRGFFRQVVGNVKAVDGVSFTIKKGETFGLVGESGCGKTTTGRSILRLIEPTSGEILFDAPGMGRVDVRLMSGSQMRALRRHMQIVFQDPYGSLNPRLTVGQIIGEPLVVNKLASGRELQDRVAALLREVGLRHTVVDRYPHAFSGGQRQRISLARALALNPSFIVADEPVSALDVSVQAQVLNLMEDLQERHNLTYLFVAHDLSVIEHISHRVAVMYVGQMVESAATEALFLNPRHPYTEALLSAVPRPNPRIQKTRIILRGEVANPARPPSGCYFHPRCRYAEPICSAEAPHLEAIEPGHWVSCHRAHEIQLRGVD